MFLRAPSWILSPLSLPSPYVIASISTTLPSLCGLLPKSISSPELQTQIATGLYNRYFKMSMFITEFWTPSPTSPPPPTMHTEQKPATLQNSWTERLIWLKWGGNCSVYGGLDLSKTEKNQFYQRRRGAGRRYHWECWTLFSLVLSSSPSPHSLRKRHHWPLGYSNQNLRIPTFSHVHSNASATSVFHKAQFEATLFSPHLLLLFCFVTIISHWTPEGASYLMSPCPVMQLWTYSSTSIKTDLKLWTISHVF